MLNNVVLYDGMGRILKTSNNIDVMGCSYLSWYDDECNELKNEEFHYLNFDSYSLISLADVCDSTSIMYEDAKRHFEMVKKYYYSVYVKCDEDLLLHWMVIDAILRSYHLSMMKAGRNMNYLLEDAFSDGVKFGEIKHLIMSENYFEYDVVKLMNKLED